MTTGDLKGCLRKLERQLRSLKYPREVDYSALARGDPSSVLPIVSYAFVSYSSHVAEHLVGLGVELAGKSDLRFVETVYKVFRDVFHYKPLLTKPQFLQPGFAEHKIGILCDVIGFVTRKHGQLCKEGRPAFQKRSKSGFRSFDLPCEMEQLPAAEAVDQTRLRALEAQLRECQAKLEKLSGLEGRLQALERDTAGKVVVDREQWGNLETRVLLLETRLALSSAQAESSTLQTEKDCITSQEASEAGPESPSFACDGLAGHGAPEAYPVPLTDVSTGTLQRLERIASMMKDTSCLLKSAHPSM